MGLDVLRGPGLAVFVVFAVVLLSPATALAFGPAAHLETGLEVIAQAGALAAAVGSLIRRHRDDFLRGILAADREVAKNAVSYRLHTHNWQRAFALLRGTRDESESAFFLGYVCHLAADVVSHNYFVPAKITESYASRVARHVYWEMRFDARVRERAGPELLRALGVNAKVHRRFLAEVLPGNLIGPRLNVRLTGIALRVQRAKAYRLASAYLDRGSRLLLPPEEEAEVWRLAVDAQLSVLDGLSGARIAGMDPRGIWSIRLGRTLRQRLRRMDLDKTSSRDEIDLTIANACEYFRGLVSASVEG